MSTVAMTPAPVTPQPPDLWALFRDWGGLALVPLAGWLAGQVRGWRRRRERQRELLEAIAESATLSADLERFRITYLTGRDVEDYLDGEARELWERRGGHGQSPRQQHETLKSRVVESRRRVWQARGFPEAPADPAAISPEEREWRAAVMNEIRTTKRFHLLDQAPKPASETTGEGERK